MREIVDIKNGIVLVTGPTGSGKSSTLAAIIDVINQLKYYHIVTIEDPIDSCTRTKNQRFTSGSCTATRRRFHWRFALHYDKPPKVILIGEMRDAETMEIAMEAAEPGHLVF